MNNYFHILVPFWGAWTKYGWSKGEFGVGLAKDRIDKLAKQNKSIIVKVSTKNQEYTISAKKVQTFPVEKIKDYNKYVYVVRGSALNYKKSLSLYDLMTMGVFG